MRSPKFRGIIPDSDVLHSVAYHAQHDHTIAPTYVETPNDGKVPKYGDTVKGTSMKFDPAHDCDGEFMSYKNQVNNNCYNYAVNMATNTFAQPGRKSGHKYKSITGPEVLKAAEYDGLVNCGTEMPDPIKVPKDGHVVALLISLEDTKWPKGVWGGDFHWARCDDMATSSWSQKDGGDQVTNFDFAGNKLEDPRKANWTVNEGRLMRGYDEDFVISYEFFAFMIVPKTADII